MRDLPRLFVLTDRRAVPPPRTLPETVAAAIDGGARAVVVREKDLAPPERAALAGELATLLQPVGGLLVVASDAALATAVGAGGVHLAASDPPCRDPSLLVGRSCHDAAEVARASTERCAWVTVSPVYPTRSKPGHGPALGPDRLARLAVARPPVYALGGIAPGRVAPCLAAGAYGVAVMGAVMRAADPAGVTAALAEELLR